LGFTGNNHQNPTN